MINSVQYRINGLEKHVAQLRAAANKAQVYIERGMPEKAQDILSAVLRGEQS